MEVEPLFATEEIPPELIVHPLPVAVDEAELKRRQTNDIG